MSCIRSVGFGLLTNVQTPLGEKKKRKKKNKLWGQEDEWIECQRLCSSSMDWLQPEVNLELKWNWWSCLGRQEVITNLWPHTYRHHGRQLNHTHVAHSESLSEAVTSKAGIFFSPCLEDRENIISLHGS